MHFIRQSEYGPLEVRNFEESSARSESELRIVPECNNVANLSEICALKSAKRTQKVSKHFKLDADLTRLVNDFESTVSPAIIKVLQFLSKN